MYERGQERRTAHEISFMCSICDGSAKLICRIDWSSIELDDKR